jgi:hypothetical protein
MQISEALGSAVDITSLRDWTVERILEWSAGCGRFLKWERDHMIIREPSAQELAEHKKVLRWLLSATKLFHASVSDPEFPERSLAKELQGRLTQLEQSWRMFHEGMPKEEAEKLLAEVFPDER